MDAPMPMKTPSPKPRWVLPRLIAGAGLISFSGVWIKISQVPPIVSAFYRVFWGGLILLGLAVWHRELALKTLRRVPLNLACGLLFALDLALYHYAVEYVGPGLGTILPNFQVFILGLVGVVFLKESLRIALLLAAPLAIAGLLLIVGIDWNHLNDLYRRGIACGLGAALCYAGFLICLRKLQADQRGGGVFAVLMIVSLVTALFIALEILRRGESFRIPDLQSLVALLALGLFSQVVGWLLIANALPHLRASLSGLILLLQPALAFVWDVLIFARPTTLVNWLGVLIALAAIYIGSVGISVPPKNKT